MRQQANHRTRALFILIAGLLSLTVIVAACSSGDDEVAPAAPPAGRQRPTLQQSNLPLFALSFLALLYKETK